MPFIAVKNCLGTLMLLVGLGLMAPASELASYQPQGGAPPPGGSTTSAMRTADYLSRSALRPTTGLTVFAVDRFGENDCLCLL